MIVSLFAGPGGACEGIRQATGQHPIGIERNPDAVAGAMTMVLSDPMPWVERGRERAARFTLEASGSALAGAYREAMERTTS